MGQSATEEGARAEVRALTPLEEYSEAGPAGGKSWRDHLTLARQRPLTQFTPIRASKPGD